MDTQKKTLIGMSLAELRQAATELGMPAFTGGQIADWLYRRHATDISEMTNISKVNRTKLAEQYDIGLMPPTDSQHSVDGTVKYLFPTSNCKFVF